MTTYARAAAAAAVSACMLLTSCASLGSIVQPPLFSLASGQETEIRLLGPSLNRPMGGLALRIWTHVENPNSFGLTLTSLAGNVFLEDQRAGDISFPLGLPLTAGGDAVVPLDISISFADVPDLANSIQRIVSQNMVDYRVDGTVTVDAAPFGQPSFGPRTWVRGQSRVIR